jgi:hypothetical protein
LLRPDRVFMVLAAPWCAGGVMTSILVALVLAAPAAPAASKPAQPLQPPAEAPPKAVPGQAPVTPGAPPATVELAGAADARKLCDALVPTDRLRFAGGALERGEAEERHAEAREKAIAGRYSVAVPAERLRFAPYIADEGVLTLFRSTMPTTRDGAVRLNASEDAGLPVEADVATARRILAAQREGKLSLQVIFVLADDEESPCFRVPGASQHTIAAEPVAWRYVADGAVLARGGEGADRPSVSVRDGAQPRVRVGRPLDAADGKDVRVAVLDRLDDIEGCYETALDRDPWVDGAIVADLQLAGAGAPEKVRIAADSVQNDELVTCVRDVLATLDLRRVQGRAFVPIHFVLDPPRAGGAAQ